METLKQFWPSLLDVLIETGLDILIIIAIFAIAKLLINIISSITGQTMKKAESLKDDNKAKQIKTSMTVTHSLNRYVIYAIAIILCLKVVGLGDQVSGAVVAAGIGGLIISFGAQSIVKDMLAGIFLLFEKQFFVGDYIKVAGYEGTVLSIALRVTYLDCAGKKVIIPNGEIRDVVNYSNSNNLAIITIPTSNKSNTRKAIEIISKSANEYYSKNKDLFTDEKPGVPAVNIRDNGVIDITIRIRTLPLKHWKVQSELSLLIKENLNKSKIDIVNNYLSIK